MKKLFGNFEEIVAGFFLIITQWLVFFNTNLKLTSLNY